MTTRQPKSNFLPVFHGNLESSMNLRMVLFVGVVVLASGVQADVITQAGSSSGLGSFSDTWTISRFDTQGGTYRLDSIDLTLAGYPLCVPLPEAPDMTRTVSCRFSLGAGSYVWDCGYDDYVTADMDLNGVAEYGGPGGLPPGAGLEKHLSVPGDSAAMALFEGAGTIDLSVTGNASVYISYVSSGAGYYDTVMPQAWSSVTYNYSPVPEPATGLLLVLGVAGLRRQRRR